MTGSSGLYYPLVYSGSSGELRAVDGATGQTLSSQQVGPDLSGDVREFSSDTTCFVNVNNHDKWFEVRMHLRLRRQQRMREHDVELLQ